MKIILKPHSGLANRIRAMVSGVSLSQELNIPLKIIWEKDDGLNCNYNDLFEVNNYAKVSDFDLRSFILQNFMGRPKLLKYIGKSLRIGFIMFDSDMHNYVWKYGTKFIDLSLLRNISGDVYINSCNEFFFKRENLQYFLPCQDTRNEINLLISKFEVNTIGVHIRRKDHKQAINQSPLDMFIEKMNEEIQLDSNVVFYLATDDAEVKKKLIIKFGARILFSDVTLVRDNPDGMRGALIDLYALAGTKKIYGSFFSSYSDIAARIGDIPLITVMMQKT